jgi:hypothetical protein
MATTGTKTVNGNMYQPREHNSGFGILVNRETGGKNENSKKGKE